MEARFTVIAGPFCGQTFPIPRGKFIVGRDADCQLLLDSNFISRHHCVLLMDDDTLRIRDLGSKNGTYVNGDLTPTGERVLVHGDTISVADLVFRIETTPAGAPSQVALHQTDIVDRDTTQLDGRPRAESKVDPPSSAQVAQKFSGGAAAAG
jgi:pSer/pThr/pTyr-binding forkhead associated (FHA) protein